MEDLIDTLGNSLSVTQEPGSIQSQHPRFSQYKSRTDKISQEERRKKTLAAQKERRYDFLQHVRQLANENFSDTQDDSLEKETENEMEDMDWAPPKIRRPRAFKDQIMLSEWLVEVPADFEDFLMVPCPIGKRSLVVANKAKTRVYARSGFRITEFQSHLPGGSSHDSGPTILDCLWNETKQCYYVLDVLCWNDFPLMGCEAEFRFYWLKSKFEEDGRLSLKSRTQKYPFLRLPYVNCTQENISAMVNGDLSETCPLDGFLFYHKAAQYTPGVSALVGWLKPYMLPEILNVEVPDAMKSKIPDDYVNIKEHVKSKKKNKPKKKRHEEMEVPNDNVENEMN